MASMAAPTARAAARAAAARAGVGAVAKGVAKGVARSAVAWAALVGWAAARVEVARAVVRVAWGGRRAVAVVPVASRWYCKCNWWY